MLRKSKNYSPADHTLTTGFLCLLLGICFFIPSSAFSDDIQSALKCKDCNVILISMDTVRADHLNMYGYHRETMPFVSSQTANAVIFEKALSSSAKTAESHMSMFTSLHPDAHGVETDNGTLNKFHTRLPSKIPTVMEVLQSAGYLTAGFHAAGNVHGNLGFEDGFAIYEELHWSGNHARKKLLKWIKEQEKKRLFLFLHSYHAHAPYAPNTYPPQFNSEYRGKIPYLSTIDNPCKKDPSPGCEQSWSDRYNLFWNSVDKNDPKEVEQVVALYDSCIWELDNAIKVIWQAVQKLPRKSIIILLSDHGEEFWEHGKTEHDQLYQEILHVPFLIFHPNLKSPVRIKQPVSLIDLTPTILDFLGIDAPITLQGESLVPMITGTGHDRPRHIYSYMNHFGKSSLQIFDKKIIMTSRSQDRHPRLISENAKNAKSLLQKLEYYKQTELYDLQSDPTEQKNLNARPEMFESVFNQYETMQKENRSIFHKFHKGTDTRDIRKLGPDEMQEHIEHLKGLGYIGG